MRTRPVLGALGLALAALAPFLPVDLRSPALAAGAGLLVLAAADGRSRLPRPRNPAAAILLASLAVSFLVAAADGVTFLRQVRAQARMSPVERRDAFLEYSVGLTGPQIAELQRTLPEDASVLVLFNSVRNEYAAEVLGYLLRPRRLHLWTEGPRFQLVDGRAAALPDEAWLARRGIRWALLVDGRIGSRVRAVPLHEVPRL